MAHEGDSGVACRAQQSADHSGFMAVINVKPLALGGISADQTASILFFVHPIPLLRSDSVQLLERVAARILGTPLGPFLLVALRIIDVRLAPGEVLLSADNWLAGATVGSQAARSARFLTKLRDGPCFAAPWTLLAGLLHGCLRLAASGNRGPGGHASAFQQCRTMGL